MVIGGYHLPQNGWFESLFPCLGKQRIGILGKTVAPISTAWVYIARHAAATPPPVHVQNTKSLCCFDVTYGISYLSHLIGIANHRCQQGIGEILNEFTCIMGDTFDWHSHRFIQLYQHLSGPVIIASQHNPVCMDEILPTVPFPQELRVVRYANPRRFLPFCLDIRIYLFRCSRWGNRGLHHHHPEFIILHCIDCCIQRLEQISQVCASVFSIRSSYTEENKLAFPDGSCHILCHMEIYVQMLLQHFLHIRLIKGQPSLPQCSFTVRVHVYAVYLIS